MLKQRKWEEENKKILLTKATEMKAQSQQRSFIVVRSLVDIDKNVTCAEAGVLEDIQRTRHWGVWSYILMSDC